MGESRHPVLKAFLIILLIIAIFVAAVYVVNRIGVNKIINTVKGLFGKVTEIVSPSDPITEEVEVLKKEDTFYSVGGIKCFS